MKKKDMRSSQAIRSCLWTSLLLVLMASCGKDKQSEEIPTTGLRHGVFYIDLYEEGEIQATQSRQILSPEISWRYGNLKLATLIEDGSEVEQGDTIMTFDPTDVRKGIVDAQQRLELHYAEREKMEAQQKSTLEGLISDLEVSRISLEISRINLESAQYEAEISRKQIELNLQQAEISLEQAESQIENTRKIQKEEMLQMNLSIRQAEKELDDAYETLEKMIVLAPSPGIAIVGRNYSTGSSYQEGEQVWGGQSIVQLPNLRELKADLKVNEVDISKIEKGQKVVLRPDAFSDSVYVGEIITIANLAVNKTNNSRIKVFPVEVLITSPVNQTFSSTPDLMPGMTVSCRILVDEIPDVDYIPLAAIFEEDGEEVVYVKNANGWTRRKVTLGAKNTNYAIVEDGLDKRDQIALSNPMIGVEASKKQGKKAEESQEGAEE